ncbi:histidine triad (HIT) family protein [Dysgonomonas alginatilytica]|uniref:Histidine triad (HIT) family protein n=1 Tax=Dysgonomonas alginatilytica TaxID=1605892 RepID=A0A2V3PS66_9BACT|nr:HIT family protein [Dysgonomonas alginatilytica]PXV68037.1 histidine triad (HIT) family protein [Dysgonomonas alginatilytica]
MSTIFSKIIKGEIPCYKIAENDSFFAFLDIRPMTKGHVLVIPKHETDYLLDLDDQILSEMIVYSKKIAKAIQKAVPCKRIGLMVIGMEVPHAHIHLIPINAEKDMNLSNPRLKLSEDEFQQITKDITSELENI